MDKSIVAVEESHWRNDSRASASKPLGSLVQINSIAIDLSCAMEETEPPLHEHFSIRGFVSGMRKKDKKTCLPFPSEGVDDDLADNNNNNNNLPPLSVPKFRWWQCSNCVPDIAAKTTALEMLLADRSAAGTSSYQHVGGGKDVVFPHSIRNIGDRHGSRESIDPINKMTNANPHYIEHNATTSSKEKKTDFQNSECGTTSAYVAVANPLRIRERHDNNAVASDTVRIAKNGPVGFDEADNVSSGSEAAICVLPRRRKPKLRSLADIMEDESNSTSEHVKKRSAFTSRVPAISTEKEDDELEASADASRSPHGKRKLAAEEDRRPANPLATAKRFKGPIQDSVRRRRILVVSDSESGGDGHTQSNVQISAKTQKIKQKKDNALEIKTKIKQTHSGNKTVPETLHKHATSVESSYGNAKHFPPIPGGEMEPYLNGKRPHVEVDLVPPRKSFIGECSIKGKLALNLSLNSCTEGERSSNDQISCRQNRGIPDLNESFTEKSSTSQWKQMAIPENRCSTLHKDLDIATSSSKQMAGEGRRQFGVSEPQAAEKIHNNVESGGASDDIPMDIVELLAMNQRERTLENSRNQILSSTANASIRGSPGFFSFPLYNSRSGISLGGGENGLGQGVLSFPPVKNCRLENGNLDENQFRLFSSSKQCLPKKQHYSAPFSGPRASEGADLVWPPRRKNAPFYLDVHHNRDVQSFADQSYKGKTISDLKGVMKKSTAAKEGRIGPTTKSLDAYSNDTIPAMQLLSLMDRGVVSGGSSFKVGSSSYLDKPFSPCNHHPRINVNENKKDPFLNGSFFPQGKEFNALYNGVRFHGQSSKKSYSQGQMLPPQRNTKPDNLVIRPSRGDVGLGVCSLNRNPADFSIPDAKNQFTLTARDLKSRKRKALKERSPAMNLDGGKRRRVRKEASAKEGSRKQPTK